MGIPQGEGELTVVGVAREKEEREKSIEEKKKKSKNVHWGLQKKTMQNL